MSDERKVIVIERDITERELYNIPYDIEQVTVRGNVNIRIGSAFPFALFVYGNFKSQGYIHVGKDLIVEGDVNCCNSDIWVKGNLFIRGDVDCDDIEVGGDLSLAGDVDCGGVRVTGDVSIDGNIDCCDVYIGGKLSAKGTIDTNGFKLCVGVDSLLI